LSDPATIVPALTGALKDGDPAVRREAILALMKCGPRAEDATPVLAGLAQRDPDSQTRSHASKAIQKLRER
jgi:HEAT repeat protein